MVGLFAIAVGAAFVAFALGIFPMDEQPPVFFRVIFGLMGAFAVYGGLHTIRFRIKQRQAFSGGREREGTLTLRVNPGGEDPMAFAIFATSQDEWMITIDPDLFTGADGSIRESLRARAYLGEDDIVYGLKLAGKQIKLSSPGHPFTGRLRRMVEKAEQRYAAALKQHPLPEN